MKRILFAIFIAFFYGCGFHMSCEPKIEKINAWVNLMPKIPSKNPSLIVKAKILSKECKDLKIVKAEIIFKDKICKINLKNVESYSKNGIFFVTLRGCEYENRDKKFNLKMVLADKYKIIYKISFDNIIIRKIY